MSDFRLRWLLAPFAVAAALAGCATPGQSLVGADRAAVQARQGAPAERYPLAAGERWLYPLGGARRSVRMLIRRAEDVEGRPVAMDGVKGVTMRLLVGREDGAPNFAMRHFTVEPGGHTPRHRHNYEHEVVVLAGRGRVEYEGAHHEVGPGDVLFVEPDRLHQFVNQGDEPFAFICLVPTTFDCGTGEPAPTPGS